mmetsp:Transcript_55496/g.171954  ORF Transcript_55496/g.171954 Transcript_55496/m.171954 type:complete len:461 (+) Transcript_55496:35-1417(+)
MEGKTEMAETRSQASPESACTQAQAEVLVRNSLTGEILLSLVASAADLQKAAEEQLPHLKPFKLCEGAATEPLLSLAPSRPHVEVNLVRLPKQRRFQCRGWLGLSGAGYHCHDSYLDRVPCQKTDSFHVAWQRSFNRDGYDEYRAAFRASLGNADQTTQLRSAPRCTEIVTLDATQVNRGRLSEQLRRAHVRRHGGVESQLRSRLLGIGRDATMYILQQTISQEHPSTLIRRQEDSEPSSWPTIFSATEKILVNDSFFLGDALYLLGEEDGELRLLQLHFELGQLQEQRRVAQELRPKSKLRRRWRSKFLGLDSTGEALWLSSSAGVHVLSLQTLQITHCLEWAELESAADFSDDRELSDHVAFDPQTRDLYVLWDLSLARESPECETPTCEVYCLSPLNPGSNPWEVAYTELPGDWVCSAHFGIDGFSDSFCIGSAHFSPGNRTLWILDARDELWSMEL